MSVYVRAYGGRDPVLDCLLQGKRLGFQPLGVIPGGFRRISVPITLCCEMRGQKVRRTK